MNTNFENVSLTGSAERYPDRVEYQVPVSTGARSRYVILRRANGSYLFELRAHNGGVILRADRDVDSPAQAEGQIDRIRLLIPRQGTIEVRRSLTGKWFFQVCDGNEALALSRPFDYRSLMDKALYAARSCAACSRSVRIEG